MTRTAFSPTAPPDEATVRAAALCVTACAQHLCHAAGIGVLPPLGDRGGLDLMEGVTITLHQLVWAWCLGYPGVRKPVWGLPDATAAGLGELATLAFTAVLSVARLRTAWSRERPPAEHLSDEDFADLLRLHKVPIRDNSTVHRAAVQRRLGTDE
ncbi:MAG: hypothetical protein HOV94_26775 [Saccharothrix sp.]|nr:hypothetical protein [Saccharothrix sp.]